MGKNKKKNKPKRGRESTPRREIEFFRPEDYPYSSSEGEEEEEEEVLEEEEGGESSNILLDRAVSKVYPSIVTITNFTGDKEQDENRICLNGVIFSCVSQGDNARFVSYIITLADLFRPLDKIHYGNDLFPVSKIKIWVPTHKSYEGEIVACDLHYNIAVIKIESDVTLPTATLTPFTDWVSVSPLASAPPTHYPHHSNIFPGDELAAVYLQYQGSCDVKVYPGKYSVDYIKFKFECDEFFRINCRVSVGGCPIINCEGDVVGIAFEAQDCTAFLPINIFFKWWKHVKTHGEIYRPFLGIKVANLFTASIDRLEPIVHDCNISDGVIVEEVELGSPAASANMRPSDVICQCDGRPVKSFLEFSELLWDKIGEIIEARGVRDGSHFIWKLEIKAMKTRVLPEILAKNESTTKKSTKKKAKEGKENSEGEGSIPSKAKTRKRKRKKKIRDGAFLRKCNH